MGRRGIACRLSAVFTVDVGRGGWSDGNFVCVLLHLQLSVKNVTAWLTFAFPSKNRSKSGKGFLCIRNCQFEVTHNVHWRTCSSCPSRRRWGAKINSTGGLFLSAFLYDIKSNWNARAKELTGRPVLSTYITGEIIACYPTWHCRCIYMTRVWNWAPECLYATHWPICPNCRQEAKGGMCLRA